MWMLEPSIRDYVGPAFGTAYDRIILGGVPGNGPISAAFNAKGEAEKFFDQARHDIEQDRRVRGTGPGEL
jgi:hypothetical protein